MFTASRSVAADLHISRAQGGGGGYLPRMKFSCFAIGALVMVGCSTPPAPLAPSPLDQATRARAWTELSQKLAGSWKAQVGAGFVRVDYQPISNGSALMERFFTVSGKETASLYHPAGDRVLVTHYCAQGNQPRLQLTRASDNQLEFEYLDATDLDEGEGVMRRLVVVLRDGAFDQIATYRNGDGKEESTTLHFVRAQEAPAARSPD